MKSDRLGRDRFILNNVLHGERGGVLVDHDEIDTALEVHFAAPEHHDFHSRSHPIPVNETNLWSRMFRE